MMISRNIHTYKQIGDTVFPVTYCENGMVLVDYPNVDPSKPKISSEILQKHIDALKGFMEKNNVRIITCEDGGCGLSPE